MLWIALLAATPAAAKKRGGTAALCEKRQAARQRQYNNLRFEDVWLDK
jgi:hypothetical protein